MMHRAFHKSARESISEKIIDASSEIFRMPLDSTGEPFCLRFRMLSVCNYNEKSNIIVFRAGSSASLSSNPRPN
jgi:hypothetical protein